MGFLWIAFRGIPPDVYQRRTEEHPQILEEEQEIRKNIQNIREEAKEVENIIKDDLKK